jgi:hypothetical protein
MSIERYNNQTALAFIRARVSGQNFIGPYDLSTYDKVNNRIGEDLEAIDFLNDQVEKYSSNQAGRVCTCDGNNEALRAYQVAYNACYDLMYNWEDYMEYVRSEYSDKEYYRTVWDSEQFIWKRNSVNVGLDDLCKRLGMAEVGTRGKFSYADYHYLKEAITSMEENKYSEYSDDNDLYENTYWRTTVNQIVSKYLNKFVQGAMEEQYKEL